MPRSSAGELSGIQKESSVSSTSVSDLKLDCRLRQGEAVLSLGFARPSFEQTSHNLPLLIGQSVEVVCLRWNPRLQQAERVADMEGDRTDASYSVMGERTFVDGEGMVSGVLASIWCEEGAGAPRWWTHRTRTRRREGFHRCCRRKGDADWRIWWIKGWVQASYLSASNGEGRPLALAPFSHHRLANTPLTQSSSNSENALFSLVEKKKGMHRVAS
nr:unnamed protein product [Spirometra erinaceieuropaei]